MHGHISTYPRPLGSGVRARRRRAHSSLRLLASQELVDHPTDLVARYSAGALKNLMATLAEAGFDPVSLTAFSLTLLSRLLLSHPPSFSPLAGGDVSDRR